MSKLLVGGLVGGDGAAYALKSEGGALKAEISFPLAKLLEPIKKNFVDKMKAVIPGSWDDALIDQAWNEAVKFLSE